MSNIVRHYNRIFGMISDVISYDILLLLSRIAAAVIFFMSGCTKVSGILDITDSTYELFSTEYKLPFVDPYTAAHLATYSEHFFPILLVLGLFSRPAALALLGMTAVIQIFVYPDAWPTHLSWAGLLLPIIAKGGGRFALDHWLRIDKASA